MVEASNDDVPEDIQEALRLLVEMNNNVNQVTNLVEIMIQRVKSGELSTENGISFLTVKYQMLLDYLINLTYVVLRKCSGRTIENDPSIDRLIEIRTILEKIRPIDYKLRYQIDKLVKTAVAGTTSGLDPSSFKANPSNLMSQLASDTESGSDSEDEHDKATKPSRKKAKDSGKSGVYVPPKLSAVHYDHDDTKGERQRKQLERAKKRAFSSSIIQDLKEEYLDIPTEVSAGTRAQQILSKYQKEKEEYEETYLTRLPVTKSEKHRNNRLTTLGTLGDEITNFGGDSQSQKSKNKKRKLTHKKKAGVKKRRFV
ncbi:Neuroguidin-A [Pseudolycoriella hygida]|uniref:Neuroguidin-A n=1 Tax=Pseudolycoriella hygida TaxID=35572 RepID=A0A9Q0S8N1_9DIPT|nr:Neuroguidin-A [Pseudolycoriella hygida]